MIRSGSSKPKPAVKKTKVSDGEKLEKRRDYERNGRTREWQEKWRFDDDGNERTWLVFDGDKMFCAPCREHSKKTGKPLVFVVGTDNFKIESIKVHEKTPGHKLCFERDVNVKKTVEETPAGKCIASIDKAQFSRLEKLFRNAHALAKNARPFSDFSWMCK